MLFKNNNTDETDYLKEWPSHYYEIPTAIKRKEALEEAGRQGILVPADAYRKKYCEKRFFTRNSEGTVDLFMYAWMMIKSVSGTGFPLFGMKRIRRELESYMENLCLSDYETASQEERTVLAEEWGDFARRLINSCAESKNYNTAFLWPGFKKLKDSVLAEKIAAEIFLVTRDYPKHFDLDAKFVPLKEVMCHIYCQMIENAEGYLRIFEQD